MRRPCGDGSERAEVHLAECLVDHELMRLRGYNRHRGDSVLRHEAHVQVGVPFWYDDCSLRSEEVAEYAVVKSHGVV